MRGAQPPRIATWLLKRLASGSHSAALMGDLIELYRRGRSSGWYWRQALKKIMVDAAHDVGDHKLSALTTILIGWMVLWVTIALIANPLSNAIRTWVMPRLVALEFQPLVTLWAIDISSYPPISAMYVLTGWIVRQVHRPCGGFVLAFALTLVIKGLVESTAVPQTPFPFQLSFVMWRTAIPPLLVLLGGLLAASESEGYDPSRPPDASWSTS